MVSAVADTLRGILNMMQPSLDQLIRALRLPKQLENTGSVFPENPETACSTAAVPQA